VTVRFPNHRRGHLGRIDQRGRHGP
jgi:hypothetical protein